MPQVQRKAEVFTGHKGRDGSTTSAIEIPPHKSLEALNVDLFRAALGRKRGGATSFSLSGSGLSGIICAAFRHVPAADETAAELWLVDAAGTFGRFAANAWTNPTLKDAMTGNAWDITAASFNGKLFFAYKSAQDRLHVWDGSTVRRTGLATAAAPSVANTGVGSLAATIRYYKIAYREKSGSSILRQGEWSSATSFTPSGSGTAARITKPAAISEGETHWVVGGSADGSVYYELAETIVATTTYDDSTLPSAYSGGNLISVAGAHTNWTSVKYLIADGNRLLGGGTWTSGAKNNRVWIGGIPGATAAAFYDEETTPTEIAELDFDENDSGVLTGFGGPVENQVIVYKTRQMWRLIPTGVTATPYRRKPISKVVGGIRQQAVVMAEDDAGSPTLYALSYLGPYRLGPNGMARLVWDIDDIWSTVNFAATTVVCHGVYHADLHQIWWWVATNSSNDPDVKIVFDTRIGRVVEAGSVRDGWVKHTGESAKARCSVMFSNTAGATMSRDLKPYIGQHGGSLRVWKCDSSATDDAGTAFQSYVQFPDRHFGGITNKCQTFEPIVLGTVGSHSLTVSMIRDYGAETVTAAVTMSATSDAATETRISKRIEGSFTSDAIAVSMKIGDATSVSNAWTLDAVAVPYEARQAVSQ